ncbi:signal recognition particle-docking protein FtsY [Lactobacillus sp.]|uniref:signal recognition particle-docking protein FtsY n=1 Tax=Lactobacillus sp. TaxID=1591 RepID=UPI0019854D6F|nr:signal recognition particle-docking protein FtsY [Lactobacillus sp.]MBD5428990.1 signal recognition particle-docking protein FtsY [Lactobacillus sp.]
MGLFDRIKNSLFGKKDEEEKKEEVETPEVEEDKSSEEQPVEETAQTTEEVQETKQEENESSEDSSDQQLDNEAPETYDEPETKEETSSQDPEEDQKEPENVESISEVEAPETFEETTEVVEEPAESEDSEDDESEEDTEESEQEKYDRGLKKTNSSFGAKLNAFFAKFRTVDEDFFEDLEDLLIESDVGFETAEELTDSLRDEAKLQKAKSHDDLKQVIVEKLVDIYDKGGEGKDTSLAYNPDAKPNVYLFVGVNGAGKTTTIGKLAKRLKDSGKSVMMVAADTFRAGAVEQLVEWGKRDDVPVITGKEKADPASVVFDGVNKAKEEGVDYLLVDTAGRLQNKVNLMNELDKIERTIKKILPDQPNEVLLVLDGSTGQNALLQAKDFDKTTKLTGLVLTKLDGSSKGGVVLAIRNEMDLPVKLVGLGEKVDDLADFDAEKFAIGLFQGLM